jgi:subtilase family serine protease
VCTGFPTLADPLLEVALYMQTTVPMPQVLSLSYGYPETAMVAWNAADPYEMFKYMDNQWKALGLMGVSIIVSSGDEGARDAPLSQVRRRASIAA